MNIKSVGEILKNESLEVSDLSIEGDEGTKRILILLGLDSQNREQHLQVYEYPQWEKNGNEQTVHASLCCFEFKVELPFLVQDLYSHDVSSLLHFINLSYAFPGFILDELQGKVYFRYAWVILPTALKAILVIIQNIKMSLYFFSDPIEKVGTGQATFNQLLEEVVQNFNSVKF